MAGSKTEYPKFTRDLYRLQETMGEIRTGLQRYAGFTTADLAAFDTLLAAVQAGTTYFPQHGEQE